MHNHCALATGRLQERDMEQDKMREDFEAWAGGRYGWSLQDEYRGADDRTLASWSGEKYENRIVEGMWQAWQASRASVVVELPEWFETYGMCSESARIATECCQEAIHDAGIRTR